MTAIFAWLATTRAGRWVLGASAAVALAAGVLLRAYGTGRDAEESRQARDSLDALRERNRIDDEVDALGDARRRNELARWVRVDRG